MWFPIILVCALYVVAGFGTLMFMIGLLDSTDAFFTWPLWKAAGAALLVILMWPMFNYAAGTILISKFISVSLDRRRERREGSGMSGRHRS